MRRRGVSLFPIGLIVGAAFLIAAAPAAADGSRARVLLTGLNSPKGLALFNSTTLAIGQGAYAPPPGAPGLLYVFKGPNKGKTTPATDPVNIVDVAVTPDGAGWAIGGDGVV
jgi:hypothetical protein